MALCLHLGSFSNIYPVYNPFYQKPVFVMKKDPDLDPESDFNRFIRANKIWNFWGHESHASTEWTFKKLTFLIFWFIINFQVLTRQITIEKSFWKFFFGISIKNCPRAEKIGRRRDPCKHEKKLKLPTLKPKFLNF